MRSVMAGLWLRGRLLWASEVFLTRNAAACYCVKGQVLLYTHIDTYIHLLCLAVDFSGTGSENILAVCLLFFFFFVFFSLCSLLTMKTPA